MINAWMSYNQIGVCESADTSTITYAMYKDEYESIFKKYRLLCKKILTIKNEKKEDYWKILEENEYYPDLLTIKVCNFEAMLHNTAFCLAMQMYQDEKEEGEE